MPAGRPKEEFKPWKGWRDDIIKLYSVGASDVEVRVMLREKLGRNKFSFTLWDRWMEEEEEFSETIKNGREYSRCWWEKTGRTGIIETFEPGGFNTRVNYTGWYMNMKNRFGWADKNETKMDHSGGINLSAVSRESIEDILNNGTE